MSAGCFSWCRLRLRGGAKKQMTGTKHSEKLPENSTEIALFKNELVTEPTSYEIISDNSRAVIPRKSEYTMATVKEVLTLSQSVAGFVPVPLLRNVIGVALKIIQVCEELSAVEQKVNELQIRVGNLMIVVLDHLTPKDEEGGEEAVVKAAMDIEEDVTELLSTLETINRDLTSISAQNQWLIAFYKETNTTVLDRCMDRLSTAMEKFKLSNDLRDSAVLKGLLSRLGNIQGLAQHVANKVDVIHKDIKQILAQVRRSGTLLQAAPVVRQQMPLKPEVFHGRDDFVEDIARLFLQDETSRVCILGPGGMGKTSVSLAVVESPLLHERFPPENRVWVPCIEATSATLLLEILYVQLQVPCDKQVTLEKIISELNASKQPRLILLDNFETPWNAPGGNRKEVSVSDILRRLSMLSHIGILVTMRGTYAPCNHAIKWKSLAIQPTDEEACLRIFHELNPSSKNDPDVSRLLSALGHMPFAVTLMANLGREVKSMAKDLLDAWDESGTDLLSDNPEKSMNRSVQLSVESDLVNRNPDATVLLSILSMLPAGTTKENLRWWASALPKSKILPAIATLFKAALLVENKRESCDSPILFVVPVVQSFMQQHDRIDEGLRKQIQSSCCQYVLDHACRFDDPTFSVYSKALAAEDTNIQAILFSAPTSQHCVPSDEAAMEALIAFSWHRCDTKPNLDIVEYTVAAAKVFRVDRYIASAIWCLGRTYYQLGDFCRSYDHLKEAYQLFNTLPLSEVRSQQLGGQCGIDLVAVARLALRDKDEAVSLARDVESKCAALSDDLVHGRSLVFLGLALNTMNTTCHRQEALHLLEDARTMLKAVGNIPNLATACQVIARVHYHERRLPEAIDAIQEAWEYAESCADRPFIQAVVAREFGMILFSANRDAEAWKYVEIALMKASYLGNRLNSARALEYMGYGYLRRGDYQNAYGAYEAAAEKYIDTIDARHEKTCKDNMARIAQKQNDPQAAVCFHRPALDIDKSLFYPPVLA